METNLTDERARFVHDLESGHWSMTELCERYGVSRPTGYKWVARRKGGAGFADRSHAPHQSLAVFDRADVGDGGGWRQIVAILGQVWEFAFLVRLAANKRVIGLVGDLRELEAAVEMVLVDRPPDAVLGVMNIKVVEQD